MNNKISLVGFPRSGNTFMRYALQNLFPSYEILSHTHTVKSLEDNINILPTICVIRNPLDSIASWFIFRSNTTESYLKLEDDLNFYIRYYNALLKNKEKILFLDFEIFKNDTEYVKNKINNYLNIQTDLNFTSLEIKQIMLLEEHNLENLPRDNIDVLNLIKDVCLSQERYKEADILFNKILLLTK
jgi:hypothetical protein